jgi:nucleotide-binding universal stress UspA family protein
MLKGTVIDQILKAVRREKSELVVMGMQGLTGLRNHLYGSNTMALIEESNIPVLVVPKKATFQKYKHIVYHTSFHADELGHIKSLLKIGRKFDAKVSIVSYKSSINEAEAQDFVQDIRADNPGAKFHFQTLAHPEGSADGLLDFARTNGADLVALTRRNHDLTKKIAGRSLTSEFVFDIDIPVLFFS